MKAKNTVRIADRCIFINGELAGHISGTSREVWLTATADLGYAFVARFKHFKPGPKSRKFIKGVFSQLTMVEYLAAHKVHGTPYAVAESIGVDYNVLPTLPKA